MHVENFFLIVINPTKVSNIDPRKEGRFKGKISHFPVRNRVVFDLITYSTREKLVNKKSWNLSNRSWVPKDLVQRMFFDHKILAYDKQKKKYRVCLDSVLGLRVGLTKDQTRKGSNDLSFSKKEKK